MNKINEDFLVISGHDYRSKRKANIHFIARELKAYGRVRFFSAGYSQLSKMKKDPRVSLWNDANTVCMHDDVECFLWKNLAHPINLKKKALYALEKLWFKYYAYNAPKILDQWIEDATTIIIESGIGIIFMDRIKHINPRAKIIYRASDMLGTIGCSQYLHDTLHANIHNFQKIAVVSSRMYIDFPNAQNVSTVPHGLDISALDRDTPSPYGEGTHIVSVGSMLFDPSFFEIAAEAFSDMSFHIIGAGNKAEALRHLPNIHIYSEMPFDDTLPYLKYADAGVAPYEGDRVSPYLMDTSLKLLQFAALGLPAICPQTVVGDYKRRYGYAPNNRESIIASIKQALADQDDFKCSPPSWREIADIIISLTPQT